MMRVVAVVPMKLNNNRLPNKNIRPLSDGTPLCSLIFSTLLSVHELDEVYVYCSNDEIQKYIPRGINFLQRSALLDTDTTTMNEVLLAFANGVPSDIYVLSHATAPFISCSSIRKGIQAVAASGYDSAFAARKVQEFLWQNEMPINYDVGRVPRTQDLPEMFAETCGLYVYRHDLITRQKRRIGLRPLIIEVDSLEGIDIDEADDFILADALYSYKKKQLTLRSKEEKNA